MSEFIMLCSLLPQNKSLADPLLGNPTGTGHRNAGHTLGEMRASAALSEASLGKLYCATAYLGDERSCVDAKGDMRVASAAPDCSHQKNAFLSTAGNLTNSNKRAIRAIKKGT